MAKSSSSLSLSLLEQKRKQIAKAGGIELVLSTMKLGKMQSHVQEAGCAALRKLALNGNSLAHEPRVEVDGQNKSCAGERCVGSHKPWHSGHYGLLECLCVC